MATPPRLAEEIREGILEAKPDAECVTYDIIEHDMGELHALVNRCNAFAVGSPTLNRDAVPPVWNLLAGIDAINSGKEAGCWYSAPTAGPARRSPTSRPA